MIAEIGEFFNKVLISLVAGIFKLVNYAYRIFLALAENNIFKQEDFASITSNIYRILSIVMLFILSYGILNKIVDPDNNKSGIDGKKIFTNFIISIVLITLCPSIFQFAYGFQSAFLNSGIIGGIFTGNTSEVDSIHYGGINMSVNTFLPFFTSNTDNNVIGKTDIGVVSAIDPNGLKQEIECTGNLDVEEYACTLERAINFASATGSFGAFRAFARNIYDGEIDFDWFAALIVGGFLCYVMISFCFDMGIRVCKLAFYQIIAPIAIFCMIIPKMDDIFKKWQSNVIKTFLSSFTRVFIMNLGVYFISLLVDFNLFGGSTDTGSGFLNLLSKCFLILGIVAFMRQAPKLLSDLFGFSDGDMKLGIKDKLKAGGAFAMGAAIGGGATALTRNAVNAWGNIKDAKKGEKAKAVFKGIGSTIAGGTSGLTKGLWYAKGAGSGKEMKAAAGKAADKSVENRMKRDNYRASVSRGQGALDDALQVAKGKISGVRSKVYNWAGYKNLTQLKAENAAMDEITNARDTFDSNVDSYIEKELAKVSFKSDGTIDEGSIVGVANQTVEDIHRAQDALYRARQSGQGVAEAEKEYFDIIKQARYGIQNSVLVSMEDWDKLDDKSKAKLGSLRVDGVKYKGAIQNNADLDALKESGIIGADFSQDTSFVLAKPDSNGNLVEVQVIKDMGDAIKISKSNNNVEIATREQKKNDDSSK